MHDFAPSIARLIDELKHLPGIGQKTAQRLAFHLLRVDREQAFALSDAIREAKEKIRECSVYNNITDMDPCIFCSSASRSANRSISSVGRSRRPCGFTRRSLTCRERASQALLT